MKKFYTITALITVICSYVVFILLITRDCECSAFTWTAVAIVSVIYYHMIDHVLEN